LILFPVVAISFGFFRVPFSFFRKWMKMELSDFSFPIHFLALT